jgi:hypothetical protein
LLASRRPIATLPDNKVLDGFLISYNARIGRRELERIRDEIYAEPMTEKRPGMMQKYLRDGVVFLSIHSQPE